MTELKLNNSETTEEEKWCLTIILIVYAGLFLYCVLKITQNCKNNLNTSNFIGLKLYYHIILLILFCNFYLVRIAFLLKLYIPYSFFLYSLFDCLGCSTLTLLGTTFALLWTEMYISSNTMISNRDQTSWKTISLCSYILINFSNYFLHIFIVVDDEYNLDLLIYTEPWKNFLFVNIAFSFGTVVLLSVSRKILSDHILEVFPLELGEKISSRVKFVSILLCVPFFVKAIAQFVIFFYYYGPFSDSKIFW